MLASSIKLAETQFTVEGFSETFENMLAGLKSKPVCTGMPIVFYILLCITTLNTLMYCTILKILSGWVQYINVLCNTDNFLQ